MALSHKFRQEIVNFLIELTFFDDANGRKAILLAAGLDNAIPNIDLSGPKAEFVNLLVDHLAQYGNVDGQPALVRLLQGMMEQVGQDRRASLHTYCEQILAQEQMAQKAREIEPYRGLSAFQEEDAQWFFGRETHAEKVLAAVRQFPFVAVLGASGSGKSSLVYAGVIPQLRTEGWEIAACRPGELPLKALAAALMPLWQPDLQGSAQLAEIKQTYDFLLEKKLTLSDILEAIALPAGQNRLVLFVDQFEEIYACKEPQERTRFLENLLAINSSSWASNAPGNDETPGRLSALDLSGRSSDGRTSVSIIITLRSDFLGQTHSYAPLSQAIAAHGIIVPVMNEAELHDAIAKPADLAGSVLDTATINLLIEQSKGHEGALPLLQFALTRIWNGMAEGVEPADTLQQIGGVGGALAGEAQRLYESLPKPDQAIMRRAFLHLVNLGEGTRDTRRRVSIPEIVAHGDDPDHVHAVLRTFSQPGARLITLMSGADDEERAEVTHEALFEHWDLLKEWLDKSRDDVRFQRRLADAANHWDEQGHPDGVLWRPPDLELLQDYQCRAGHDMTALQTEFFQESTARQAREEAEKEQQRQKELDAQRKIAEEATARREAEAKAARNLRRLVRGIVVIFFVAVGAALFAWYQQIVSQDTAYQAEDDQHIAEQRRRESERVAAEAVKVKQEALKQARVATARYLLLQYQNVSKDYPQLRLLLAIEAVKATQRNPLVAEAEQALRDELSSTSGRGLGGHVAPISIMAISPDGRWLVTGSGDGPVGLWDLQADDITASVTLLRGHADGISGVAVSQDGHWLVTGSKDGAARLWDLQADNVAASVTVLRGHEDAILRVKVSPDSRWLVTGSKDGAARLWDLQAIGNTVADVAASSTVLDGHDSAISILSVSPDSRWLVTRSEDRTARLWDLQAIGNTVADVAVSVTVLRGHEEGITDGEVCPDSRWLVLGSGDGTTRLWDLQATGNTVADVAASVTVLRGHEDAISRVTVSPDGRWLVTGSKDGAARLWDLQAADVAASSTVLGGHDSAISTFRVSPDSRWLVTGSKDGAARLWNLQADDITASVTVLRGHEDAISRVLVSPDGHWLVTHSDMDNTMRLWNLQAKDKDIAASVTVLHGILGVAISSNGYWLMAISRDGTARLWNLQTEDVPASATVLRFRDKAVSQEGRWLATHSRDGTVRLWDLQAEDITAASAIVLGKLETFIFTIAASPDGRWLTMEIRDGTVLLWDLRAADIAASAVVLGELEDYLSTVVVSPDSHWLVTYSADSYTAWLWDLRTDDIADSVTGPFGHEGSVSEVTVSPGVRWLVTENMDGTVLLWDLQADDIAAPVTELCRHEDPIWCSWLMGPTGRWLVAGRKGDNAARLWDLQTADIAASVMELRGHESGVGGMAISPDGHWLVTSSRDRTPTARLWNLQAGDIPTSAVVLGSSMYWISDVIASPDGRWLVIPGWERDAVSVWDLQVDDISASAIILRGHKDSIDTVAVSPDSRRLITSSYDDTVRLWDLQADDLIARACRTVGRNFSSREWNDYFRKQPYRRSCSDYPVHYTVIDERLKRGEEIAAKEGNIEGNIEKAVAIFKEVQALYPESPKVDFDPRIKAQKIAAKALSERGEALVWRGKIDEAVSLFEQALELDPDLNFDPEKKAQELRDNIPELDIDPPEEIGEETVKGLIKRGQSLAGEGKIQEALAAYTEAQQLYEPSEISAQSWNALCRKGSLWGHAAEMLNACEKAVALEPAHGGIRDSRGLARALTGDIEGAIEDFRFYVEWADNAAEKAQREGWIEALQAGENPFTDKVLESLK